MAAALAEAPIAHHRNDSLLCLLTALRNDDALAEGESVRFHDDRHRSRVEIGKRRIHVVKCLIGRRGDAVFLHKVLREDLTALDDGCRTVWAKAWDTRRRQRVHRAKHQRVVRRDHGIVDPLALREGDQSVDILCPNRYAHRIGGDAAVAGRGNDLRHGGVLFQFFDNRVLASAAAYNQKLHSGTPFPLSVNGGIAADP